MICLSTVKRGGELLYSNVHFSKPDTLQFITPREAFAHQPGAVAGKPVEALINRCIAGLHQRMDPQRYIIIGTGGVFTAEDAYCKIRLGASLVQFYTALIYNIFNGTENSH